MTQRHAVSKCNRGGSVDLLEARLPQTFNLCNLWRSPNWGMPALSDQPSRLAFGHLGAVPWDLGQGSVTSLGVFDVLRWCSDLCSPVSCSRLLITSLRREPCRQGGLGFWARRALHNWCFPGTCCSGFRFGVRDKGTVHRQAGQCGLTLEGRAAFRPPCAGSSRRREGCW